MDLCASDLQDVDRPIPAVGRLQHDLRPDSCLRDLPGEHLPVVAEPHRLQLLPVRCGPHHHRAPAMQIQTNDLRTVEVFAHRGLLRHWDMSTASITR
jgi:hypothetical protein